MRSLSWSATAIRPPSGEYDTCEGLLNFPSPVPGDPNLKVNAAPAAPTSKTCTRSLPVSATATRPPSGDQATDEGPRNVPLAVVPIEPNVKAGVPFGWYTWTR